MNQNTKMLLIGSVMGAIVIAGIWGAYTVFQSTGSNRETPSVTPTPTITGTPLVTTSITPSVTTTPTPTETATPTPTVAQGKDLTLSCTGTEIGTYTFALKNVPEDVTYTKEQSAIWCTFVLRQGSKKLYDV